MESNESSIFAPIDENYLNSIIPRIPAGDKIVYSTFVECAASFGKRFYTYDGQLVLTDKGIAVRECDQSGNVYNKFFPLHEIYMFYNSGTIRVGHSGHTFKYIKEAETKDQFKERQSRFISKFRPIVILLRQEWLAERHKNTNLQKNEKLELKQDLDLQEHMIKEEAAWREQLRKEEEKRRKEEEKRLQKEAKKK